MAAAGSRPWVNRRAYKRVCRVFSISFLIFELELGLCNMKLLGFLKVVFEFPEQKHRHNHYEIMAEKLFLEPKMCKMP